MFLFHHFKVAMLTYGIYDTIKGHDRIILIKYPSTRFFILEFKYWTILILTFNKIPLYWITWANNYLPF